MTDMMLLFHSHTNSVNFLSGNPLNRVGWLRSSPPFLNNAARSPNTKWFVFKNGDPLVVGFNDAHYNPDKNDRDLRVKPALLSTRGLVQKVLALDAESESGILFGQVEGKIEEQKVVREGEGAGGGSFADIATARLSGPVVVFLGVLEDEKGSPVGGQGTENLAEGVRGIAYFALDAGSEADMFDKISLEGESGAAVFAPARLAASKFSKADAAIFSEARSMLDWNTRNKVNLSLSLTDSHY